MVPGPIRRKLGLEAGDSFDATVEAGRVILAPRKKASRRPKIVVDPVTGLPAVTFGPEAPQLTSRQVREVLDEFP